MGNVIQDTLPQLDGFEVGTVGTERLLRIRAGFDIFEELARNPAARRLAQVLDSGHDVHIVPPISCSPDNTIPTGTLPSRLALPFGETSSGRLPNARPSKEIRAHEDKGCRNQGSRWKGCADTDAAPDARRQARTGAGGIFSGVRSGCRHPAARWTKRPAQALNAKPMAALRPNHLAPGH